MHMSNEGGDPLVHACGLAVRIFRSSVQRLSHGSGVNSTAWTVTADEAADASREINAPIAIPPGVQQPPGSFPRRNEQTCLM